MTTPALDAPRVPLAVVTGGAAGIGRAVAERLATDGFRVVCADVLQHDLPALDLGAVPDAPGLVWAPLDVTDHAAVRAAFDDLAAAFGGIDALVNNAGIQRHRALEDLTWDEWSAVVDVNLHGVFACLQAAGRHMLAAGRGAVVNISSVSARGSAGRAPYSTTKAAVIGLTATAGAEWAARGVRVNAVAPGYIDTGVFRQGVAQGTLSEETILARIPARRLAQPEEIGNAVSWLVSDQAAYMVGQTVYVDGGFLVDYGVPLAKKPE
ncbi:3-oxoacyl-[acyl-carrier protein] reductase [Cellulosimicrobium aquatile]|uniref:3-oxoacyl-[acyl-carrier protein] reductase n=1 Tax=Cellulosimicrobium aquatile TaxID=1612203 RepID=A0A1N6N6X5_9MICO|nr:SDR family NAD(P)-dependent oxidoreductase [Cellulosimicrobium aquatile]SIP87823.1 3-oxoacyl-[acyl-carrier protein] reductase [Cellulosimicrobium aquatile]